MRIDIYHYHYVGKDAAIEAAFTKIGELMSKISDKIAELASHVDGAIARAQADHQKLADKVDALKKQVDEGKPEDIAAMNSLEEKLDLFDAVNDITPDTPDTPTPVPATPDAPAGPTP
jgi:SMC interacting uncharacterized protein involved in chromosome segregation